MSIEKIIENTDAMRALFGTHGFENVRLFKGFLTGVDEKTFEMLAFPKMMGMGRGRGTHPVFMSDAKELPSESIKKVEDSVNELTSKFSTFTTDELMLLREKLLQSMDQKLAELQIQKTV